MVRQCSRWPDCDATHGARADGTPLGIPADKATRKARQEAHTAFDRLWRGPEAMMGRAEAYKWLQGVLGLGPEDCHIARLHGDTCQRLIQAYKDRIGRRE